MNNPRKSTYQQTTDIVLRPVRQALQSSRTRTRSITASNTMVRKWETTAIVQCSVLISNMSGCHQPLSCCTSSYVVFDYDESIINDMFGDSPGQVSYEGRAYLPISLFYSLSFILWIWCTPLSPTVEKRISESEKSSVVKTGFVSNKIRLRPNGHHKLSLTIHCKRCCIILL